MEFTVQRASDYWDDNKAEQVTINTIEELQKLNKKYGNHGIIIYFDKNKIWIYDDYME